MDLLSLSGQLCWEPTPVHFPPTWDVTEGLGVTSSGLRHSGVIRYGAWLPGWFNAAGVEQVAQQLQTDRSQQPRALSLWVMKAPGTKGVRPIAVRLPTSPADAA